MSAAVLAVKKAYDANDINIPFPIRTLDFDPKMESALRASLTAHADSD